MAFSIINAEQSFIRFDAETVNTCYSCTDKACIPVNYSDTFAFQFHITATELELDDLLLLAAGFGITLFTSDSTPVQVISPSNIDYTIIRLSPTELLVTLSVDFAELEDFEGCDQQMFMMLDLLKFFETETDIDNEILATFNSNCLIYTCDLCYTTHITYRNNEDAYGFVYCLGDDFVNKVRLPFYLSGAQFPDEEEIYFKSNGQARILSSITRKEYQLQTDSIPEWMHEAFKLALSHDSVTISGNVYSGEIRKNGNYRVEWDEFPGRYIGQGTTTVNATPFNKKNTMCEDCGDCDEVVFEGGSSKVPVIVPEGFGTVPIIFPDYFTVNCQPYAVVQAVFDSDYIEGIGMSEFGFIEVTFKEKFPETLDDTTDLELTLKCACKTSVFIITIPLTCEGLLDYEVQWNYLNNCDGTFTVTAEIRFNNEYGSFTATVNIYNDNALIDNDSITEENTSSTEWSIPVTFTIPEGSLDRIEAELVIDVQDCIVTLDRVPVNICNCPTEEEILELITFSIQTDYEPTEFISRVEVDASLLIAQYPDIQGFEIRAQGGSGEIVTAFSSTDTIEKNYPEIDAVCIESGCIIFAVICCLDGEETCETTVELNI